ncbi:hypothetical protein A2529_05035 [Candidatus Peribacteria bacterium RIFOXYD2_FULL_58_15]|nr:MAG: hypothetical protein A2529_05035 [Candidatus Peribacteria bacterium RIFOXYD2_FULL_58_15]
MRAVTVITITLLVLPLLSTPRVAAFGEINSLEWEIGGLRNEVQNLNNTLRMQRSHNTFRSLLNVRSATLLKLSSMGYEVFRPLNEGSILAGSTDNPLCSANAHALVDFCVCDQGYVYTGIVNKCQRVTTSLAVDEYLPCPPNSYVKPTDASVCVCNGNYQWNTDKTQCLRKQKPAPTPVVQLTKPCRRDKDGICQCPAGYKPSSKTPFVKDGNTYFYSGKQVCTK